jgi:predicted phage terminase large subunit-like protein
MSAGAVDHSQLLALAHQDLACYSIALWRQFELAPHHDLIIRKLEAIERGEIKRLMIFLPPRHGKSFITSSIFPAWFLGKHPERHVIFATYGQELSDDFGRPVRNFIADRVHQEIFPNCRLSEDSTSVRRFNTTAGGAYFAVGRGGSITGRGAHLLLIDDPIKGFEEANSETVRKALHEWYASVAYTRLMPGGAIIIIQTRWHEDDLAGWLLREHSSENWDVLSLPAIAEQDEGFRKEGEALWPGEFPLPVLQGIRTGIGGRTWASLYQQRPAAAEGVIFKRDWWQRFSRSLTVRFDQVVQSWDTAFKRGTENDFSVCTTWGVTGHGYYLLHLWRQRVEFPELKRALASLEEQWEPHAILVEDKASGQSLIQELQLSTALPLIPVKVDSDKQTRAQAVTPLIEAGKVFLPESAPWLVDFIEEMARFPNGVHDDVVDATTQALNYLRVKPPRSTIELGCSAFAPNLEKLDKEALWEKARGGYPMSPEEIERM